VGVGIRITFAGLRIGRGALRSRADDLFMLELIAALSG